VWKSLQKKEPDLSEAYGEEATELEREVTTITRMHIFDRSIKDQFTITKYA
jgi:hypothetical protein